MTAEEAGLKPRLYVDTRRPRLGFVFDPFAFLFQLLARLFQVLGGVLRVLFGLFRRSVDRVLLGLGDEYFLERSYTAFMTAPSSARPGRNDPCHCGSGRKYKHCCLEKDEAEASAARAKATAAAEAAAASEGTAAAAPPKNPPKSHGHQPWKAGTTRGFVPKARTPRKVGGS
jgi:hypothetical protein